MKLLALDLSTKTGWALFESNVSNPVCGTVRLPKVEPQNYAGRTLPLMQWLEMSLARWRPEIVGFEAPFIPWKMDGTTQHTCRLQISLAAIIETIAAEARIPTYEVAPITAKKALTGRGRGTEKIDMVAAALDRGWRVGDDHQADACGVAIAVYDILGTPVPLRLAA